jgi:predicted RNA-binding Zn-ribbon protein involved in translation (DUF1610 family)
MAFTKTPKSVSVSFREETIVQLRSEYTCPSCHTTYIGYVNTSVTRFKCSCGQELIVKRDII